MKRTFAAAVGLCLASCAPTPSPSPPTAVQTPLADEATLAAAEQAPLLEDWAAWNAPFAPFTVIGNIHYVGVDGIGAYLITTDEGHILLDGGFAQSAPLIAANVAALGFEITDVKMLLNSHAHVDHAGGLARLQRLSGAQVIASAGDRAALEAGRFPYGPSADMAFPPVRVDRVIADGEAVELGGVALTAHLTPGHTPGCTSWSMEVRGADGAPHRAFFHCSATVAGQSLAPEAYPEIVRDFRETFARVGAVDADVLLTNHPSFMRLAERRAQQIAGDGDAFVDPAALGAFNNALAAAFEAEFARQQGAIGN